MGLFALSLSMVISAPICSGGVGGTGRTASIGGTM